MIGRGSSGYRGIGYEKDRKSKPWRIKVGRKTINRFRRLSDACTYVADHAHVLYPKEHGFVDPNVYPNVPTTDPEQSRVGRKSSARKSSAREEQPQEPPQPQPSVTSGSNGMAPSAGVTAAFLERTERTVERTVASVSGSPSVPTTAEPDDDANPAELPSTQPDGELPLTQVYVEGQEPERLELTQVTEINQLADDPGTHKL